MRVRFNPTARSQFLAALAYSNAERASAARALRERAQHSLSRLAQHPESGSLLPEFPDLPFCEVILSPYRFFYRVKEQTVWIVAVWHGTQVPDEPDDEVRIT